MCQAAELVREALVGLVLERIGVHGVEVQPTRTRVLVQHLKVVGAVPRDVEGHRRRRPHEAEDRRAVVELVEDVAGLARAWKSREPRAAGSDAPRRHGDAKRCRTRRQRLDVEAAPPQHLPEVLVVLGQRGLVPAVVSRDQVVVNLEWSAIVRRSRRSCSAPSGRCRARGQAEVHALQETQDPQTVANLSQESVLQPAVDGDDMARRSRQALRDEQEDCLRLILRLDRAPASASAWRRTPASLSRRASVAVVLVECGIPYLASDAITRSRGNIVLPLTTVAGATAFTRTSGAISTASSRTR